MNSTGSLSTFLNVHSLEMRIHLQPYILYLMKYYKLLVSVAVLSCKTTQYAIFAVRTIQSIRCMELLQLVEWYHNNFYICACVCTTWFNR